MYNWYEIVCLLQAELPPEEDTFIQISTPKGRKRRRISSHLGTTIARLSIIPNLEKSFVIGDEEDFEVHVCNIYIPQFLGFYCPSQYIVTVKGRTVQNQCQVILEKCAISW